MNRRGIMLAVITTMLGFLIGAIPGHTLSQAIALDGPAPVASGTGGVVGGKVLEVETHTLVIENSNEQTVRVRMPGKSGKTAGDFSKGDYIEAAVTPEGMTTSVRIVENMHKH